MALTAERLRLLRLLSRCPLQAMHMDVQPIIMVISRDEVDSRDTSSITGVLKSCLSSSERALSCFEKLDVAFDGYEDDTREVFETPEVREYVALLDEEFPYWLFF
jgi:hypothetical protein